MSPGPSRAAAAASGVAGEVRGQAAGQAVSQAVWEALHRDPLAARLQIELVELAPGFARLRMPVTPDHLNFLGAAHGAAIFALADAAHAAASNSHGTQAVALNVSIEYLSPAGAGEVLVAEARELQRGRRTALYHIQVRTEAGGRLIAACHGRVYRTEEPVPETGN